MNIRRAYLVIIIAICSMPGFLMPLASYCAVAPSGSAIFTWVELLLSLPAIPALLAAIGGALLIRYKDLRTYALLALIAGSVYFGSWYVGSRIGHDIWENAFRRLAQRSEPLIAAINAYEARHGTWPPDLPALVPEFIPEIPPTAVAESSPYEYYVGDAAGQYHGNPWVLVVHPAQAGIGFDKFFYFPMQNYPKRGYGGWVERIEEWGYVHE